MEASFALKSLALRCLPLAPESWRARREALKTKCEALKTMWLDRPRIYPYDTGHQFLNRPFDLRSFRLDLRKTCAAQPSAPAMAGGKPDLRRDRDHSFDPDRADHGAFGDGLDHRRSRTRADRSRL